MSENEQIMVPLNSMQSDSNAGSSSKRIRVESSEQVPVDTCLNADYSTMSIFETDVHVTDVTFTCPIPTVTVTSIIETDVKTGGKEELTPREKDKARMKLKRYQQREEETSVENKFRLEFRDASQKESVPLKHSRLNS